MKVIGAGFMRTGTLSMQAALTTLGLPCYHMQTVLQVDGHVDAWLAHVEASKPMDWRALFEAFEATVDTPGCWFYKEILQAFPEAKVILTVRDAQAWFESFEALCESVEPYRQAAKESLELRKVVRLVDTLFDRMFAGSRARADCMAVFERHNAEVLEHVTADRLLVFDVSEGWEPLCRFLECPVPAAQPFPHLNKRAQLALA
jgi:Sulfotransferase domain